MYRRKDRVWSKHFDFIFFDVLSLQLSFILVNYLRHGILWPYTTQLYGTLGFIYILVDICVAVVFNSMYNVYRRGYYKEFLQTLKHAVIVMLIMILYLFSLQKGDSYSRIVIFLTSGFHVALGYLIRIAWKKSKSKIRNLKPEKRLILVSEEKQIPEIIKNLKVENKYNITGLVVTDRDAKKEKIEGIRVVANLDDAADYFCRRWIDEVFIYPSNLSEMEMSVNDKMTVAGLIAECIQMSIPIHFRVPVLNISEKSFIDRIGSYNVLTITSNYASSIELAIKRILDIAGGIVGCILALFIIIIFGPIIKKQSPGPVLFRQIRIGKNGKKFFMYKIRSMYMDAEERKKSLMDSNRNSDGMMFKLDWDPRIIGNKIVNGKKVTGIGEFIRRYSLDEFPQFYNVLIGQMSLVGTRPPTMDEWEKYKYHHRARLATKPGITGLWQVSGRSKITNFEEVVRLDTEYIQRWNIGLDIRILLKTIVNVIKGDGAL